MVWNEYAKRFQEGTKMSLMGNIFYSAMRGMKTCFVGIGKEATLSRLQEELVPIKHRQTQRGNLAFYCPSPIALSRANTLLTKEPETIQWLNGMPKEATLWDIGANVGVFSLYAALNGNRVLAFEPAAANYLVLNKNIEINRMDDRITALCLALGDTSQTGSFNMWTTQAGSALHEFGDAQEVVTASGKPVAVSFRQGMLGMSADDLMKRMAPPVPNYVKIDVDGLEEQVIKGALETFSRPQLQSLLVEFDTTKDDYREMLHLLEDCGLKLSDQHRRGKDSAYANHIFHR